METVDSVAVWEYRYSAEELNEDELDNINEESSYNKIYPRGSDADKKK